MFKNVTINLTGPICKCKTENLSWGAAGRGLVLECKLCHVTLTVPNEVFVAHFKFDAPYPDEVKPDPPAKLSDPKEEA